MSTQVCPCGCGAQIATSRLACRDAWYRLPVDLRAAVWAGQIDGPNSARYEAAASEACAWFRDNPRPEDLGGSPPRTP